MISLSLLQLWPSHDCAQHIKSLLFLKTSQSSSNNDARYEGDSSNIDNETLPTIPIIPFTVIQNTISKITSTQYDKITLFKLSCLKLECSIVLWKELLDFDAFFWQSTNPLLRLYRAIYASFFSFSGEYDGGIPPKERSPRSSGIEILIDFKIERVSEGV
jgi:hypothetical protein